MRLVSRWVSSIGFDPVKFATLSMRRTKLALIYHRIGNLRAARAPSATSASTLTTRLRLPKRSMVDVPGQSYRALPGGRNGHKTYILTRTQVVVGAVITCHPARQLRMRIGAADGIDFLHAGRVDSELHDQPIR